VFSFASRIFLISFFYFFKDPLIKKSFSLHALEYFLKFLLLLISSLLHCGLIKYRKLFQFSFICKDLLYVPPKWSILKKVPGVAEKNVYSVAVGWIFCTCLLNLFDLQCQLILKCPFVLGDLLVKKERY
jgi:hypothetical protein